jgi:hypothetical protein
MLVLRNIIFLKKKQGTWHKGLLHFKNRDRKTYHIRKPSTIHQEKRKTREKVNIFHRHY